MAAIWGPHLRCVLCHLLDCWTEPSNLQNPLATMINDWVDGEARRPQ